jgi:hypothetical protein
MTAIKLLGLWCAGVFGVSVSAQNYTINWATIDSGGGTSTGGIYTVTGTIGQPSAGTMTGDNYNLVGGFWGVIAAVQMPGAPALTVAHTAANSVIISWPSPWTDWKLQQNGNVNSTNWTDVVRAPADDGTNKTVTVSPPLGNIFYRLRKQ